MSKTTGIFKTTGSAALLASMALIIGCSSTSNDEQDSNIYQQAIDGYIVGANVSCDGTANGTTAAAGRYTCPAGTTLATVSGGSDVGYDATKTSGGIAFTGILSGPTSAKFITPVSTLAVEMAKTDGKYDPEKLEGALATIRKALGQPNLSLDSDPSSDQATIRLNAQVHQIVSGLTTTSEDYAKVMSSFGDLLKAKSAEGTTLNVAGDLKETLTQLNSQVARTFPELEIPASDLADIIPAIEKANKAIEEAETPEQTAGVVTSEDSKRKDYAIAIDKYLGPVVFQGADGNNFTYTTIQYETETKSNGKYTAQLNRGIKRLSYDPTAIRIARTLNNVPIDVGIEIKSTDDNRKLSIIGTGLRLSATKDDSTSIVFTVPSGSEWTAYGTQDDGTEISISKLKNDPRVFDGSKNGININFDEIASALKNRGYVDITKDTGNFKITLIINGIKINRISGDEPKRNIFPAFTYGVEVDNEHELIGPGFQGFVTILEDDSSVRADGNTRR